MKYPLSMLLLGLVFSVQGQNKESSSWYFGRGAGIAFGDSGPVAKTDGAIDSFEGSATVSDKDGNLLLYTNGETVWNKNHQVLSNGQGLSGHNSASQSSVIVSHPDKPYLYYLFVIDATERQLVNGLTYSIVDIREENGLGRVTLKNNPLIAPVGEKITVAKHANQVDVWIVVHEWNTNTFHAFLLQSNGVVLPAVVSSVGTVHAGGGGFMNLGNSLGTMKISPKGNKIAVALNGDGILELFDFDNSTGAISNATKKNISMPYGIEFSPDESKLYVSTFSSRIYQFEVDRCAATFLSNDVLVGSTSDVYLGSLQLGLDDKIYVARYKAGYLGVINSPDEDGPASGFIPDGIYLGGKECSLGLPNFNTSIFGSSIFEVEDLCQENKVLLKIASETPYDSIEWILTYKPSNETVLLKGADVTLNGAKKGLYQVKVSVFLGGVRSDYCDRFELAPVVSFSLPPDTILCEGTSLKLAVPELGSVRWQDGSSDTEFTVDTDGTYWAEIDNGACKSRDSITVSYNRLPKPEFPTDTTVCFSKTLALKVPAGGTFSFEWSDGTTKPELVVRTPGSVGLTIQRDDCSSTTNINVLFVECYDDVVVPNVITPNDDGFNDTFRVEGLDVRQWRLRIYSRWGDEVYSTLSYDNEWSADDLTTGVYYFVLARGDDSGKEYKGWVHVILMDSR